MRISGKRVVLRPLARDHLSALPEGTSRTSEVGELLVIERPDDDTAMGVVAYRLAHPTSGWLTIDHIELAPKIRGWGYGSEAVRLLEAEAIRLRLATAFRADVPAGDGLALYFWLRLGYRPALPEDAFWRADHSGDTMTMIRISE